MKYRRLVSTQNPRGVIDMAAIGLTDLAKQVGTPKIGRLEASDASGQRFLAAMDRANVASAAETQPVDGAANAVASKAATDGAGSTTTNAAERARRALDLDPSRASQKVGDSILHGLQSLSGVFAAQEARINSLGSRPASDINTLFSIQLEVAKFSALVDVTSKLTGKSTQVLDTLLKGQ
jgi:hypothetical protein